MWVSECGDMGVALDYISLIFIREHECAGLAYMFNTRSINGTSLALLRFNILQMAAICLTDLLLILHRLVSSVFTMECCLLKA